MNATMTDAALAARQASSATQRRDESDSISRAGETITAIGGGILRYGLVAILLYFGTFKFTATEAEGIRPLLEHSPLMSWLYLFTGVQGASNLIGAAEIVIAALLLVRPVAPRATVIGSLAAVVMFLVTLSFLFTTPDSWGYAPDFPLPLPGPMSAFIMKDLFLLGGAIWSLGEALQATRSR
jgi:reactive chlorine resistance protein C